MQLSRRQVTATTTDLPVSALVRSQETSSEGASNAGRLSPPSMVPGVTSS